jgi:hypothetical protein
MPCSKFYPYFWHKANTFEGVFGVRKTRISLLPILNKKYLATANVQSHRLMYEGDLL